MILHYSPASPFVRKVRVVAAETGLTDQIELVAAKVGITLEEYPTAAHNPLAKIPTLIPDDGPALYDSRVICRYLDSLAGGGLYPADRPWATLTLEATADGLLDASVAMVYEHRYRPADKVDPGWIEAQWAKASRALDALEERWMSHLAGPLDIGHIGVGCALGHLDLRHDDRQWRATRPALAAWEATFAQRPSMVATRPAP